MMHELERSARPLAALVAAMVLITAAPAPVQAGGGPSTTVAFQHAVCYDNVIAQTEGMSCDLVVRTTTATSGGFQVALGFAWTDNGPDGVAVAFSETVISCPAASGAACGPTALSIRPALTTWAPDTQGYRVTATRLCSGAPCDPLDQSAFDTDVIVLRNARMTVGCPGSWITFMAIYCEALVVDGGGAGVPSRPSSPERVEWDVGTGQSCILIPQEAPYAAACAATFHAATDGRFRVRASWDGDADHGGRTDDILDITVERRPTIMTVSCPAAIYLGDEATCTAVVSDPNIATHTAPDLVSPTGDVNAIVGTTAGSGLVVPGTVCTLLEDAPNPSECSFSMTPTTADLHTIRLYNVGTRTYDDVVGVTEINVLKRPTTTILDCTPPPGTVPVNSPSTCVVTAEDTSGPGAATPVGTVALTVASTIPALFGSERPGGDFGGTPCALAEVGAGHARCTFTFTPWLGRAGTTFTLRAGFVEDVVHAGSSDTDAVTAVRRTTTTDALCTDDILIPLVGPTPAGDCSATVEDTSTGIAVDPTGTVEWAGSAGAGLPTVFPSATTCVLDTVAPIDCVLASFTPTTVGDHLVTGRYVGDLDHATSQDSHTVHVHAATSIVYSGAQAVVQGEAFSAKAILASAVTGCSKNRPADPTGVAFFLDRDPVTLVPGPYQIPAYVGTDNGGRATLPGITTTGWVSGVYVITAAFLGDGLCDASSDDATLLVAGAGDAAHGGGWVPLNGRTNFAFVVHRRPGTGPPVYDGQFILINNGKWRMRGELHSLVHMGGSSPAKCASDGVGALSYAWTDPATQKTSWVPAIDGLETDFGIYFEEGGQGGKRSTDKWTIHIDHVVYSPPEPRALPGSTDANAPTVKAGDMGCG